MGAPHAGSDSQQNGIQRFWLPQFPTPSQVYLLAIGLPEAVHAGFRRPYFGRRGVGAARHDD